MKKFVMIAALIAFFAPSALAAEFTAMNKFEGRALSCGRMVAPVKSDDDLQNDESSLQVKLPVRTRAGR